MKISRTGLSGTSPLRRTERRGGGNSSAFAEHLSGRPETPEAQGVRGTRSAGGVDSLLSVQEMGDALEQESQARQRAEDLLESLDDLRHGLLCGTLSRHQLEKLGRLVRARRVEVKDPKLLEILDQIELRAEIELAKYATLD